MSLHELIYLVIFVRNGTIKIDDGALIGLRSLGTFAFRTLGWAVIPAGLLSTVAASLRFIQFQGWPSGLNLNEMFANDSYRLAVALEIYDVELPQGKMHRLAAKNLTAFRRLQSLYLENCGIETIDPDAFDAMAHTLKHIDLNDNAIKLIDVTMFRKVFETKTAATLHIDSNIGVQLQCTCQLLQLLVMLCPFSRRCLSCWSAHVIDASSCAVTPYVFYSKFIDVKSYTVRMSIIKFCLAHAHGLISMRTNFTSRIRLLLVDLDAMQNRGCTAKVAERHFKCLFVDEPVDHIELNEIVELNSAEFVSITAIPVLYQFGARPMHSITVRQNRMGDNWMFFELIVFAVGAVVVGFAVGSSAGICSRHMPEKTIDPIENYAYPTIANAYAAYEGIEFIDSVIHPIEYGYYDQMDSGGNTVSNDYHEV